MYQCPHPKVVHVIWNKDLGRLRRPLQAPHPHLHLHMARTLDVALQEQAVVVEGR